MRARLARWVISFGVWMLTRRWPDDWELTVMHDLGELLPDEGPPKVNTVACTEVN